MMHPKVAALSAHTDAELLDLYQAAKALAALHDKSGGLAQSRRHYEAKADEYRQEILLRMAASPKR